ncbi:MAG: hypothetical protein Q4B28_06625 [bacterium]|nr:hypothetical protein [bacterium]
MLLSMGLKAYLKRQHKQSADTQQTQEQRMEQLKDALKNLE